MRVFSYIVTHDSGFSPNPFHGLCTLACCKPKIRQSAQIGDLIVGLASRGERVIYAMTVSSVVGFAVYWADSRYASKRPDMRSSRALDRRGDNIYEPTGLGEFRQLHSRHSNRDGSEKLKDKRRDLGGVNVLVAERFAYFGEGGPPLPSELAFLKTGRGHRCRFTADEVDHVARWFEDLPLGIQGAPAQWPSGDSTWRPQ